MESSFCSYNFSIAYAVKFFGPSGWQSFENKPNKVRTRFFRFFGCEPCAGAAGNQSGG